MFSGYHTQSTVSWKKALSCNRRFVLYSSTSFFRQFRTAHQSDRQRNGYPEKNTQARIVCLEAQSKRHLAQTALEIESKQDNPLLIVPHLQTPQLDPPLIYADPYKTPFESKVSKKAEKSIDNRRGSHVLDPFPDNEKIARKASRALSNSRFAKWANKKSKQRALIAKLQDKGSLSRDWSVPLNLLKEYYKATSIPKKNNKKNFDTIRAARATRNALACAIPEPTHWTMATFDRYVYDLAQFVPPTPPVAKALELRKQGTGPHTVFEVGQTLCNLFGRTELRQFFKSENWNAAIEYLTKHAMLIEARAILLTMEDLSMTIPTSTFNIFMRFAAHNKDLHTFNLLLTNMIRRDISPDAETWFIFILCVDSLSAKRLIIAEMTQMGILNTPHVMKQFIMTTAQDDMIEFLAKNREPKDFLYRMRLNHGPNWLAHRTGNTILNEVCKRISLAAGLELVEAMKLHGFTPSRLTFRTLFFQALTEIRNSLPLAVYILESYAQHNKIHFNDEVWDKLFLCAWDHGYLNVIRVVWVAACLDGRVTHKMLRKIRYSFRLNTESQDVPEMHEAEKSSPVSPPFTPLIGHFILGFNPLSYISLQDFRLAERRYVRMAQTGKLRYKLSYNLREAYRLDVDWQRGRGRDLHQKLAHRLPILLDIHTFT